MPRLQRIAGSPRSTRRLRSPLVGLVAVALAALVPAAAASGAVPSWTVSPSTSTTSADGGVLVNVACPTTTSCIAVGSRGSHPFAQHWDGRQWSIMETAPLGGGGGFTDIACPSATACFAIGNASDPVDQSLFERWDGTTWSILPGSGPSLPRSLACASPTDCFVVGSRSDSSSAIQRWNGTVWAPVESPVVDPDGVDLTSVACPNPTSCYAVGTSYNHGDRSPLIEHWDGSAWSVAANPAPPGDYPSLNSVSCASDTMCFAVGTYRRPEPVGPESTRSLTERWNGVRWSIVPSLNASKSFENTPTDVACVSATTCFATRVVNPNFEPPARATVDRWNGTTWTVSTTLSLDAGGNSLYGLACASATTCVAVGRIGDLYVGAAEPIIERWNGARWAIDPMVEPTPTVPTALTAASCAPGGICVAVGWRSGADGRSAPLIERRIYDTWRAVTSPVTVGATLTGVSCVKSSACFAVGSYPRNDRDTRTLAVRWDGQRWAVVKSPNPDTASGATANRLLSVSCPTTACFAVGSVGRGTARPLIERWDGSKWTVVPSPTAPGSSVLKAVSCSSPTKCFAVGRSSTGRSLTERWDGTRWKIVAAPAASGADDLAGVSCVSATACVAVGTSTSRGVRHALILRWNGHAWSRQSIADGPGTELRAVSCTGPTTCVAVGSTATAASNAPFVATRDGASWQVGAGATNAGIKNATLGGVTCVDSTCVAVGVLDTNAATHTLVEQRN